MTTANRETQTQSGKVSPQREFGCACPAFSGSWSCVEIRYVGKGYDPEDYAAYTDEPCGCPCHDEEDDAFTEEDL